MRSKYRQTWSVGRTKIRSNFGGMLIFVAVCMLLFLTLAMPIIIFSVDLFTQTMLQNQAAHIALQSARVIDDSRYWLDLPRPDFPRKKEAALSAADAAANVMCTQLGMRMKTMSISLEKDNQGDERTVCQMTVDVSERLPFRGSIFGFNMSSYFSGKINVSSATVHQNLKPYALIHLDAPTAEDQSYNRPLGLNRRDVAIMPAYGFFNNMTGTAGAQITPYGKGIAAISTENFFAMNHYHLKKTDLDYVQSSGNPVPLSGWHPSRIINGNNIRID